MPKPKELTLIEAVILAGESCPHLFTYEQMMKQLVTIEGFEDENPSSIRSTVTNLKNNKRWKKVGTTAPGGNISIYCDCRGRAIPDVYREGIRDKIASFDADTSLKDVMAMLENYIQERGGNEAMLSGQVNKLQGTLADKEQEIIALKKAHAAEIWKAKERYLKLYNQVKAIIN